MISILAANPSLSIYALLLGEGREDKHIYV